MNVLRPHPDGHVVVQGWATLFKTPRPFLTAFVQFSKEPKTNCKSNTYSISCFYRGWGRCWVFLFGWSFSTPLWCPTRSRARFGRFLAFCTAPVSALSWVPVRLHRYPHTYPPTRPPTRPPARPPNLWLRTPSPEVAGVSACHKLLGPPVCF